MGMIEQKRDEHALRLRAIGERLGRAIDGEVKQARALGDHGLERKLLRMREALDADMRDRQEALAPPTRKPRGVAEWSQYVRTLRAQYALQQRPALRVVETHRQAEMRRG